MQKLLQFRITNLVDDDIYKQMINVRNQNFYESPFNTNYWYGGLHCIYTEQLIKEHQQKDPNSYFALATDEKKTIKAYARFSTEINDTSLYTKALIVPSNIKIAMLHVIVAAKNIQGHQQQWKIDSQVTKDKIGTFFYKRIFDFCSAQNSKLILSDVCIYPIPNVPSLVLHRNFNFIPLALDVEQHFYDTKNNTYRLVKFVRLVKVLSLSFKLKRLSDDTLHLIPA